MEQTVNILLCILLVTAMYLPSIQLSQVLREKLQFSEDEISALRNDRVIA